MSGVAKQRRNRRKARAVSDHAIVALHKYYLRAQIMRGAFHVARDDFIQKYGNNWKENTNAHEAFNCQTYIDYWYAGIFTVVEGYENLSLNDADVEKYLQSPFWKKLRGYRGSTYHFSERYFDDAIREFLALKEATDWLSGLDMALGHFLLKELRTRRERIAETVATS